MVMTLTTMMIVDFDNDDDDDKEECWLCPRVEGGEEEGTGPGSSPPTQIIGMTTMMMIIFRPNQQNSENLTHKC